jgi:hypothetical protein
MKIKIVGVYVFHFRVFLQIIVVPYIWPEVELVYLPGSSQEVSVVGEMMHCITTICSREAGSSQLR